MHNLNINIQEVENGYTVLVTSSEMQYGTTYINGAHYPVQPQAKTFVAKNLKEIENIIKENLASVSVKK